MVLTKGMIHKGFSNGSCEVITEVLHNGEVQAAFPTNDGIQVSLSSTVYSFLRSYQTSTVMSQRLRLTSTRKASTTTGNSFRCKTILPSRSTRSKDFLLGSGFVGA
jgi:hypothetical protein